MRPHGRAEVSSRSPQAFAICDRCGFLYNHSRLQWQFDFAGASLINKRILVCDSCNDTPQNQLRAIIVPADPIPIQNPRTQDYATAETDFITISEATVYDPFTGIPIPTTTKIVNEDGTFPNTQVLGPPIGLDQNAIMPLNGTVEYGVILSPLSVISTGTRTVTMTFSSAHGLVNNDQVAVQGLSNDNADGFYSVVVGSATQFSYQANVDIAADSLLQSTTLVKTALVGLPYNYAQIPQTGI